MIRFTRLQKVLEALSLAVLLFMIVYLAVRYAGIPDQVPTGYNAAGEIRSWSHKSSLFAMLGASALVYILITAAAFFPRLWRLPVRVTEQNKHIVTRRVRTMFGLSKLWVLLLLGYMMVRISTLAPLGMFLPAVLVGALVCTVLPFTLLMRAR